MTAIVLFLTLSAIALYFSLPAAAGHRKAVITVLSRAPDTLTHSYRSRRRSLPVECLTVDPAIERTLVPAVRQGVRKLERALTAPAPDDISVVLTRSVEDSPVVLILPDGTRRTVLRLSIEEEGRARSPDELLSALWDAYVALLGLRAPKPRRTSYSHCSPLRERASASRQRSAQQPEATPSRDAQPTGPNTKPGSQSTTSPPQQAGPKLVALPDTHTDEARERAARASRQAAFERGADPLVKED